MCGIKNDNISDSAASIFIPFFIVHPESGSVTGVQCCSILLMHRHESGIDFPSNLQESEMFPKMSVALLSSDFNLSIPLQG